MSVVNTPSNCRLSTAHFMDIIRNFMADNNNAAIVKPKIT